jgi:serine/threonine protein kinase
VSFELANSSRFPGRVEPGMFLGSYEVLLCVARGGMACVWAARQHGARGFNRLVALKTVLPELAELEFEGMFLEEARFAARIHHPNVCEVFELVEHSGVLALSMEWVDGDTLNGLLTAKGRGPLEPRLAAHIVAQVACGLHAAHELTDDVGVPMQLVHRDVSPQNILISRAGHVKVADFGVAKAMAGATEHTESGRVKGKLSYMSPEQAEGKALDRRSDIFALGVVLYVATVGAHPFRRAGDTPDDHLLRLLVGRFPAPSEVVPGFPRELEAIILRAMSREPDQRFASADEMRGQLLSWLVASGPLLTEQHVGRCLSERVGDMLQTRAERISRCIRASQQARKLEGLPGVISEVTFMPTTSGSSGFVETMVRPRSRRHSRAIGVAAAALVLAMVGTLSFSGGKAAGERSAAAASGEAERSTPAAQPSVAAAPTPLGSAGSPGALQKATAAAPPPRRAAPEPAPAATATRRPDPRAAGFSAALRGSARPGARRNGDSSVQGR